MFCNLLIEFKRRKLLQKDVAKEIGISEQAMYKKMVGKSEFTLAEMEKIREMMPDYTIDYLFRRDSWDETK